MNLSRILKVSYPPDSFTEKHLSTFKFSSNDIFDIIQQLDPTKALVMTWSAIGRWKFQEIPFADPWMHIEWRFLLIIEKEECSAYSQEKRQTMLGKLLPCLVTTNLWQNPGIFNEIFHFFIQNGLISQNR